MYTNVSDTFLAKLAEPSRHFAAKFTYQGTDVDLDVYSIRAIAGTCGGSSIAVGCAFASYIEVEARSTKTLLEGKEVSLELGLLLDDGSYEYIPFGWWTIQKPSVQNETIVFQAVDRIASRFNGAYKTALTYPAPISSVISELSENTGVLIHCNLQTSVELPAKIENITNRGALAIIAATLLANAWCDRNGEVWITAFKTRNIVNIDYDTLKTIPSMDEEETTISGIKVYTVANKTDAWIQYGTEHMIELSDIYMTQPILDQVASNIVDLVYGGGTVSFMGNPLLDPSDSVVFKGGTNMKEYMLVTHLDDEIITSSGDNLSAEDISSYEVPCMEIQQFFDGGLLTTITAPGSFETTEKTIAAGPITEALERQQNDIETAQENATQAQETADDALETASNAVVLANGKNKIFYQDSAPTSGMAVGDLWMNTGVGNALYEYKSTGWTLRQLGQGSLVAGSVTANEIAANTITANEIASRTITASKIASNTITADELNVSNLSAISANLGTITAGILKSSDYSYSSGTYTTAGMVVDLNNKVIRTPKTAILADGSIYSSNVNLTGVITATSGSIGPWTLNSSGLFAVNTDGSAIMLSPSGINIWEDYATPSNGNELDIFTNSGKMVFSGGDITVTGGRNSHKICTMEPTGFTVLTGEAIGETKATLYADSNYNAYLIIRNSVDYNALAFSTATNTLDITDARKTKTIIGASYVNLIGGDYVSLLLRGATSAYNTYSSNNPKIVFQNSDASQNGALVWTDYDSVQAPASLTLAGNQGGEYFIAPNIKANGSFYGNLSGNATTANSATTSSRLSGFSSGGAASSCTWGNQTGTAIYVAATSAGGGVFFRENNPSSGQVSMGIDGVFYQREGSYMCLDTGNYSSYALPLSGGTMTGYLTTEGGIVLKNTNLTKGTAPSAETNKVIVFTDKDGYSNSITDAIGAIYGGVTAANLSYMIFRAYKAADTSANTFAQFLLQYPSSGTATADFRGCHVTMGNYNFYIDSKLTMRRVGDYLGLNDTVAHTSGIYCGASTVLTDGYFRARKSSNVNDYTDITNRYITISHTTSESTWIQAKVNNNSIWIQANADGTVDVGSYGANGTGYNILKRANNSNAVTAPGTWTFGNVTSVSGSASKPVVSQTATGYAVSSIGTTSSTKAQVNALGGSGSTYSNYSWTISSSDIRLKENIEDTEITDAMSVLNKLPLRSFDWKDGSNPRWKIGFIADEIEEIEPMLVGGGGYDEEGAMNVKYIDTFYMTGYIVKGLQEHDDRIAKLEREIKALKGEVA